MDIIKNTIVDIHTGCEINEYPSKLCWGAWREKKTRPHFFMQAIF